MVEYASSLDTVFSSLSDPTRRDILRRVSRKELSISEIAADYNLTFAAISKHLKILEQARLIVKRKKGKERMITIAPRAFMEADEYLGWYKQLWNERFDSLDDYLRKGE